MLVLAFIIVFLCASTTSLNVNLQFFVEHQGTYPEEGFQEPVKEEATSFIKEIKPDNSSGSCPHILYSSSLNISHSFPGVIAHGIHSMSASDVRHFFPSSAKSPFNIPVVNPDLKSDKPILFQTPEKATKFKRYLVEIPSI